ncbi:hypothetical protein J5Y09_04235 [Roseomonas sp. PWR1]|uniref:Uncharacterized protein n=1 Tax=Roseomonas nitratireducens TaxID=2820810 RepID=A0ABS4APF0_9PROT|nr:hypothetical protein [Neoroseomonas nitratireducens]MBP0463109.1 hypothetical protein [Neoroseomonas nitratireducens]
MRRLGATFLVLASLLAALPAAAQGDHRRLSQQISARFDEPARVERADRHGAITLIRAEFTTRANSNEQYLLMDRAGTLLMVAAEAERFEGAVRAALAARNPEPGFWPATQALLPAQPDADGGRTFRFAMPVTAMCRACETIGVAEVGLSFDAAGNYRGARLVRVAPLGPGERWDRPRRGG